MDDCEKNQELAYRINVDGPKNLSVASNEVGAVLVHISSDYVYDGRKKEPYLEEDDYAPQSVYGMTKMKGDAYVTEIAHKYFIVRTAWLYGEGKNFPLTMLKLAEKR